MSCPRLYCKREKRLDCGIFKFVVIEPTAIVTSTIQSILVLQLTFRAMRSKVKVTKVTRPQKAQTLNAE